MDVEKGDFKMVLKINSDRIEIEIDIIQELVDGYSIADYDCVPSVVKNKSKVCDLSLSGICSADIPDNILLQVQEFMHAHNHCMCFIW